MPTFGLLTHDELLIVALIAMLLVVGNLWTFVSYGYEKGWRPAPAAAPAPAHARKAVARPALGAAVVAHARRVVSRQSPRRRAMPRSRPAGHRSVPHRG